jgi:hypothetical protein
VRGSLWPSCWPGSGLHWRRHESRRAHQRGDVFLSVVSAAEYVTGAEGERAVDAGEIIALAPREPHGMRAGGEQLVIAAFITPRPGSR